MHNLLRLL